jgi:hypothetical protein
MSCRKQKTLEFINKGKEKKMHDYDKALTLDIPCRKEARLPLGM